MAFDSPAFLQVKAGSPHSFSFIKISPIILALGAVSMRFNAASTCFDSAGQYLSSCWMSQ